MQGVAGEKKSPDELHPRPAGKAIPSPPAHHHDDVRNPGWPLRRRCNGNAPFSDTPAIACAPGFAAFVFIAAACRSASGA